ncbi:Nucleotide-binding universal stress protein, UspA family [Lentzea fradiae]|uniref:Nucleotide-binding universal stress protein, UspA family n=1 Tax=Lentzea fradiae TaxID=200378 RepID=A0A1G8DPF1_9PSEU|nr:universal stress protein [Lentzea fradiae]SDH59556.1 Nucleotide-binding universal stress protein, UspA family [Lentzea fradiae]
MRQPVIVVGVDGSTGANAALRWALHEAARRGARVEAVLAYHHEPVFVPATSMALHPYGERPQRHPARELHANVVLARAAMHDASDVAEVVVVGDAADHLVEASRHADLLVLGTRGHGALAGAVLGSVATKCLRHAECPVVVIPPHAAARAVQAKPTSRT